MIVDESCGRGRRKASKWVRMISSTESNVGNQQLWVLPQLQDLCLALGACTHVYCLVFTAVAEACALLLLNAGPRGTGADGP